MGSRTGLITMHNVCNMGAVLQAYALQARIEMLGSSCEIINYIPNVRRGIRNYVPKAQGTGRIRNAASCVKWLPHRILWRKPYRKFTDSCLHVSGDVFYQDKKAYGFSFPYDVFVTGSDQVWNPDSTDGFDPFYFLDFVKGKKKVSYAASISRTFLQESEKREIARYLDSFGAVSVREQSAVELLAPLVKQKVECVLDPSLLLAPDDWEVIGKESSLDIGGHYLLVYMLGNEPRLMKLAEFIAEKKRLKIVKFAWDFRKKKGVHVNLAFQTPWDFVAAFSGAEYVVTNSFHGTAFSINYGIDFACTPSSPENPRFVSILRQFGIMDRMYNGCEDMRRYLEGINYADVHAGLNRLRKKSVQFIRDNIINAG